MSRGVVRGAADEAQLAACLLRLMSRRAARGGGARRLVSLNATGRS
jgi:hypothetical protein